MKLTYRHVNGHKEHKSIKKLIKSVFSKDYRFPVWFLALLSRRNMVDFISYYDENHFVGFSYEIKNDDMVFLLYIVVDKKFQSHGYGSLMLDNIKERHENKQLVVLNNDIESLKEHDRASRKYLFFIKNGFMETGYYLKDEIKFCILSTKENFDKHEFSQLIKEFSYEFYNPKLYSIE